MQNKQINENQAIASQDQNNIRALWKLISSINNTQTNLFTTKPMPSISTQQIEESAQHILNSAIQSAYWTNIYLNYIKEVSVYIVEHKIACLSLRNAIANFLTNLSKTIQAECIPLRFKFIEASYIFIRANEDSNICLPLLSQLSINLFPLNSSINKATIQYTYSSLKIILYLISRHAEEVALLIMAHFEIKDWKDLCNNIAYYFEFDDDYMCECLKMSISSSYNGKVSSTMLCYYLMLCTIKKIHFFQNKCVDICKVNADFLEFICKFYNKYHKIIVHTEEMKSFSVQLCTLIQDDMSFKYSVTPLINTISNSLKAHE